MYCQIEISESQVTQKQRGKTRWPHIENREEDPVEKHDSDASVGHRPPRGAKRGAAECSDLTPVKGENSHGQTVGDAEELIDLGVVRGYPANPREA